MRSAPPPDGETLGHLRQFVRTEVEHPHLGVLGGAQLQRVRLAQTHAVTDFQLDRDEVGLGGGACGLPTPLTSDSGGASVISAIALTMPPSADDQQAMRSAAADLPCCDIG